MGFFHVSRTEPVRVGRDAHHMRLDLSGTTDLAKILVDDHQRTLRLEAERARVRRRMRPRRDVDRPHR